MGFDPVQGIGTGCQAGMVNLRNYLFGRFGGRDLGCYNPRSVAGGGPSLHAEGRAGDFGFNAFDAFEQTQGNKLFTWAVLHADEIGLQEMLWRGAIWYWPRRLTEHGWSDFPLPGVYGPVQQNDHMSHVHLGVDADAGANWTTDRLTGDAFMALTDEQQEGMYQAIQYLVEGRWFPDPAQYHEPALFAKLDEILAAMPSWTGGGLSELQVRAIVRSELDKTKLGH